MRINSRLSRNINRKTKQKLVLTLLGIVLLLICLLKFGIPLLVNFSLLIAGVGQSKQDASVTQNPTDSFIAVPVLNDLVSATNSANLVVAGTANQNQTVQLYLNDNLIDTTNVNPDNTFSFQNVTLNLGDNQLKVRAAEGGKTSAFSETAIVAYKNKPPTLTVDSPSDNQSFSKDQNSVTVSGKTDPETKVYINDFQAIVDSNGNFSYVFNLQNGDNQLKITAIDSAGNKTEIDKKVTYSQ